MIFKNNKICSLSIVKKRRFSHKRYRDYKKVKEIRRTIKGYYKGIVKYFPFELNLSNFTNEQKSVYKAVLNVEYGHTITYKELKNKLGFDISYRRLSKILNECPILILIPTHRVIRSNGQAGSFSINTEIKKSLLNIEKKEANLMKKSIKTDDNVEITNIDSGYSLGDLDFFKQYFNT